MTNKKKEYRHEEPPNPYSTGTGLPNSLGVLFMALFWGVIFLFGMLFMSFCGGCTSYTRSTRTGTLGGHYTATVDQGVFHTRTTERVTAPTREEVADTITSPAMRQCIRDRAGLALLHSVMADHASDQGGFVAVVPPRHPTTVVDERAYCSCEARGGDPSTCLARSLVPVQPTVVQNPWFGGWGYGQSFAPFSGTGGAPGVR